MKVYAFSPIDIGYTMSHKQLNRNVNNEKVKFQACSIIGYTIYVTQTITTQTIKTQSQRKQRNRINQENVTASSLSNALSGHVAIPHTQ